MVPALRRHHGRGHGGPGWLRLVPLLAHLSLTLPPVRQVFDVEVASNLDVLIHSIRIYLIYGGTGLFLTRVMRITLPFRTWGEVQWFIGAAIGAASVASAAGIGQSVLLGELDPSGALPLAEPWFLGDALGAIMVPPMLIPAIMVALGRPLGAWRWPSLRAFAIQAPHPVARLIDRRLGPVVRRQPVVPGSSIGARLRLAWRLRARSGGSIAHLRRHPHYCADLHRCR